MGHSVGHVAARPLTFGHNTDIIALHNGLRERQTYLHCIVQTPQEANGRDGVDVR